MEINARRARLVAGLQIKTYASVAKISLATISNNEALVSQGSFLEGCQCFRNTRRVIDNFHFVCLFIFGISDLVQNNRN